jgi:hypothetical protein
MKSSWWLVGLVGGCSFEHGAAPSVIDASLQITGDAMVDAEVLGAWSMPVDMGLSSGAGDDDPSMTDDMLEIYWGSRRDDGEGGEDVWMAKRDALNKPWSTPAQVPELSSSSSDTTMKVSGDGLAMFFSSNRFSSNDWDLFVSRRDNRNVAWGVPVLVTEISTTGGDYSAHPRVDLKHVVWCAGPSVADEALYVAERAMTTSIWSNTQRITELDEPGVSECDPMEPNARAIYYSSSRDGKYNIYRAERVNVGIPYGNRTALDSINLGDAHDRDPWVSADERVLVFSSDRSGVDRLYMSTR